VVEYGMENAPWRIIIIAAGASLILLFSVYFITLPKKATFEVEKTERILEFKSAYFSGRENGKKVWEFYARRGWSGKNNDITYFEDISRGKFYKEGDLIVKDLMAPYLKAWRQSKVVEAFGLPEGVTTGESRLSATIAFTPRDRRKYALLRADRILYNPNAKTSTITGRIKLKEKESSLFADAMTIDHEKETAAASGNINIIRSDLSLACEALEYFAKGERILSRGKISSIIKGNPEPTIINCSSMELFADPKKDISASGSLEVFQGKKIALCDSLTYNKAQSKIILNGKVKTIIEKAQALLKKETVEKLSAGGARLPDGQGPASGGKSEEAKKLLYEKTVINSDQMQLSTSNGDANAYGNVIITQKDRIGKADKASYSEKSEMITLSDNVYLKKENQWIRCKTINVSVKDETFDAVGSVEAEFRMKR